MASSKSSKFSYCVGSAGFDPNERVEDEEARKTALELLEKHDFQGAVTSWFKLPARDSYVYHAMGSVLLAEVQHVVRLGSKNGLHDWYRDAEGKPLPPPPRADIEAYISVFAPETSTVGSLKSLGANAKKGSLRASVAAHLASRRFVHPGHRDAARLAAVPRFNNGKKKKKNKNPPPNPYWDFWAWSCRELEWAGPCSPESERGPSSGGGGTTTTTKTMPQSHHVLSVLMHHFGCAVPSYEALEILRVLAAGRAVADVGSGGGYWTFALRRHGNGSGSGSGDGGFGPVLPVDSAQSAWRVSWVGPGETAVSDGARWLARPENAGGRDIVLLIVYPVVGSGSSSSGGGGDSGGGQPDGAFTRGLLAAYRGDTVAVVGTQNHNGYTGFRDMTFAEYMDREQPAWTKVVQVPLPSFAGKDEALFVYQRGERAPPKAEEEEEEEGVVDVEKGK